MNEWISLSRFYYNMLKGNQMKELIKVLLEKSGYEVFPYGYESSFLDLKKKLREKGTKNSRTVRKIRSSPDLLVYDDRRKDLMLVEIKMRRAPTEKGVILYTDPLRISCYKEFWNDAILVLAIPSGNVLYAQRLGELEIRRKYDVSIDFDRLEDIFTRVDTEDLLYFRSEALKIMG